MMSSVMSTLCDPMDYTVHGILQARILEWVAFPFSRGSSQPRDRTGVYCIADGFFTNWAVREALRGQSKVRNQDIRDQREGVEDSQVWCWLRTNQIKSIKNQDQMNDQKTEIDKETKSWTNWFWKGWRWKAEMGLFREHQWPHLWIEKKLLREPIQYELVVKKKVDGYDHVEEIISSVFPSSGCSKESLSGPKVQGLISHTHTVNFQSIPELMGK